MAAITDSLRKVYDFVMDGFRGENPFVDMNDEDDYGDEYEYEEVGSALREIAPAYAQMPEKHTESKVISVFGDGIKLNRKTHLFSLINVPENKFAEWAIANFDNIKIETADAKKLVDKRIKNFIEIRKVEMETQCGDSYEVALNIKETDFNYRLYGILESRRAKQIVIKCTKPNLVKLRDFINQTKGRVVVSDESNINRNDIARMFHYNDI